MKSTTYFLLPTNPRILHTLFESFSRVVMLTLMAVTLPSVHQLKQSMSCINDFLPCLTAVAWDCSNSINSNLLTILEDLPFDGDSFEEIHYLARGHIEPKAELHIWRNLDWQLLHRGWLLWHTHCYLSGLFWVIHVFHQLNIVMTDYYSGFALIPKHWMNVSYHHWQNLYLIRNATVREVLIN
jgi:hypothetical protein